MNSTFRACWLASSEVISQVLFTSEQPKKNKEAFVGIFSQIKLLFGRYVIQLVWYIHRMQIWRTTWSSPGTSYMKARLVSLRCFVLKVLPQKTLALSSLCSVLFRCAYELLCFWMRREGIEIFHLSPLGKIVDQCNSSRWKKGVHDRRGN